MLLLLCLLLLLFLLPLALAVQNPGNNAHCTQRQRGWTYQCRYNNHHLRTHCQSGKLQLRQAAS
jgi:hypothetical protein